MAYKVLYPCALTVSIYVPNYQKIKQHSVVTIRTQLSNILSLLNPGTFKSSHNTHLSKGKMNMFIQFNLHTNETQTALTNEPEKKK